MSPRRRPIGNDVKAPQGLEPAPRSTPASITRRSSSTFRPTTILKLLRVHSYDVDFKQKVKAGDTFEMFFDGGSDDEVGELLYTSMTIDGKQRKFYRFRTPDDVVDYYDEQGNSAKKFLMRNPVKGGRFTSGFGERRHPLLKIMRMHTGVDWAAPAGTPILAAGDGTVEQVGGKGGYGNYVRIRHANGYSTAYGHMSRYADGVAPGVAVKQGQVIGYVGSTGMSTGPHCHFEVLVNNNFVNPMTIAGTARPAARGPPARRVPKRAQPHRSADADGSGHEPRRASQLTDFVSSFSAPSFLLPLKSPLPAPFLRGTFLRICSGSSCPAWGARRRS